MLSQDALLADDGDGAGRLAAGFSPSLAKGYLRGDPRGDSMGTSLSVPPPPPPPPPPSQAPPRGFYKPSATESAASFQVAARESTGSSTLVRHWTIAQAEEFQYTNSQLGPSSCAPASVLSALSMIKCLPKSVGERLTLTDGLIRLVRQRSCKCRHGSITADSSCSVPLQQYLTSRGECGGGGSVAMIDLVEQLCPTVVGAAVNVGETYPFASDQVVDWISEWMLAGAALTVTSNRQNTWEYLKKNPHKHNRRLGGMPDSWHAQPIIGVDTQKRQVVFANPVKVVSEQELEATLASPATLRVRGNDVLLHCQGVDADKIEQYNWPSASWRQHAVSEQILLLRKHFPGASPHPIPHHRAPTPPRSTPHPCAYVSPRALCPIPAPYPAPCAICFTAMFIFLLVDEASTPYAPASGLFLRTVASLVWQVECGPKPTRPSSPSLTQAQAPVWALSSGFSPRGIQRPAPASSLNATPLYIRFLSRLFIQWLASAPTGEVVVPRWRTVFSQSFRVTCSLQTH